MADHVDDRPVKKVRVEKDVKAQKAKYGGFNFGAAFFGWLVSVGIAALLTALLSAAGSAIAFTAPETARVGLEQDPATVGVVSGGLLLLALAIAYYAGGYVAGRMSRFDGGRQGFGVWIIGIAMTLLLAGLGAALNSSYNLLGQINLPRIPVSEGDLTSTGLVTLLIVVVVTAFAAISGGKIGQLYHSKVDRAGRI